MVTDETKDMLRSLHADVSLDDEISDPLEHLVTLARVVANGQIIAVEQDWDMSPSGQLFQYQKHMYGVGQVFHASFQDGEAVPGGAVPYKFALTGFINWLETHTTD